MSDESTQLKLAQDLVKDGEYEQARAILSTLTDNPTAQKWLEQLNERYPNQKSAQEEDALQQAQEHIDKAQYPEARAILQTISHNPLAQNLLSKIDKLENYSSGVDKMGWEFPNIDKNTLPIPSSVSVNLQSQIINRIGDLNGSIVIGALAFGILSALVSLVSTREIFVTAILNAILFGGFAYALAVGLSLTQPTINNKTLLAFVGFLAISLFVGTLISGNSSSSLVRWFFFALYGIGSAYLFSRFNQQMNLATNTAISTALFPLTAIALTLLFFSHQSIIFIFKSSSGLGLGDFIGGLLGGLVVGALFSAIIAISLRESR